ncbi:MAG: aminopeptidase P family protein [bacterium]
MIDYAARYQKVLAKFTEKEIDALLVTNPYNQRYLTGLILSDAELVLVPSQSALFVDSRYLLEARQRNFPFPVEVIQFKDKYKEIPIWLENHGLGRIGIESDFISYRTFLKWREKVSGHLVPCEELVEMVRIYKDEVEIQLIGKSLDILARVIRVIPDILSNYTQITERDVSLEIEYLMKKEGSERPAFDLIVASGERAAMPHAAPSDRKFRTGELVLVDLGAVFKGYHSDLTRTFCLGEESEEVKKVFHILKAAQEAAIEGIRPGKTAKQIDALTRGVIEKAGYGQFFGHGTGHGVGIEVHELPRISPASEAVLEEGMVFTVEPGIYLPDHLGMRLEDMVLVTRQGCRVLSQSVPKEVVLVQGW